MKVEETLQMCLAISAESIFTHPCLFYFYRKPLTKYRGRCCALRKRLHHHELDVPALRVQRLHERVCSLEHGGEHAAPHHHRVCANACDPAQPPSYFSWRNNAQLRRNKCRVGLLPVAWRLWSAARPGVHMARTGPSAARRMQVAKTTARPAHQKPARLRR